MAWFLFQRHTMWKQDRQQKQVHRQTEGSCDHLSRGHQETYSYSPSDFNLKKKKQSKTFTFFGGHKVTLLQNNGLESWLRNPSVAKQKNKAQLEQIWWTIWQNSKKQNCEKNLKTFPRLWNSWSLIRPQAQQVSQQAALLILGSMKIKATSRQIFRSH